MLSKIVFVLLSISLSEVVQGSFIAEFTTNVETNVKNLLGLNCMVESVLNLEDAADEFSYEIKNKCGKAADLKSVLANTKHLMKITTKVVDINDEICDNAGYDAENDAEIEPTAKCATLLKYHMAKLLTSFTQTETDIDNALLAPNSSGACVKIAMTNFKYFLETFGSRIATCAELADQV